MNEKFNIPRPEDSHDNGNALKDTEPRAETIQRMNEGFTKLLEMSPNANRTRQASYVFEHDFTTHIDPIMVFTRTTGDLNADNSSVWVALPLLDDDNDGSSLAKKMQIHNKLWFEKKNGDIFAAFTLPAGTTPRSILEPLLANSDLPDALLYIASLAKNSIVARQAYDDERFDALLSLQPDEYDTVWQLTQQDLDKKKAPTATDWLSPIGIQLPNNEFLVMSRVESVGMSGMPITFDTIELTTDAYEFRASIQQNGDTTYVYEEVINDEDLPKLTDAERTENPYMVTPMDTLQPQDGSQGVFVMNPEDGLEFDRPMTGYAVINPLSGDFMPEKIARNQQEAQEYAELLHARDLAKSKLSTKLTQVRAEKITETLDNLISTLRQYPHLQLPDKQ